MPSNHLILCCPLLLPSIFPSIKDFSNESAVPIRWSKYWSLSFGISPFSEYAELISFKNDWFDLLAVQGTLKSLHQHDSSEASILQCCAIMVHLSQQHVTTGKTIALTIWSFVGKVTSLLFNTLSRALVTQLVKNLPAMWETWVQSLGWEDPLEEGMATHSSILAWRISMDRGAWGATIHGVARSQTRLSTAQQKQAYVLIHPVYTVQWVNSEFRNATFPY